MMEGDNVTVGVTVGVLEPFEERYALPYPLWITRVIQALAWPGMQIYYISIVITQTIILQLFTFSTTAQ